MGSKHPSTPLPLIPRVYLCPSLTPATIPADAKPVAKLSTYRVRLVKYDVYRLSDCKPKRKVNEIQEVEVDVLMATFTANKAAKRYRDAASSHYHGRRYGFASYASLQKHMLYDLKEQGIVAAYRAGRLEFVGLHGRMALYRGEGYCFHSCLIPCKAVCTGDTDSNDEPLFMESAPKGAGEARLKDAVWTLQQLPDDEDGFRRVSSPAFADRNAQRYYDDFDDEDESENW